MKKFLTIVLIFICAISSLFTAIIYGNIKYNQSFSNSENTAIYIDGDTYNNRIFNSRKEFLNAILSISKKYNLIINRETHDTGNINGDDKTVIYTSAISGDEFFNKIPLRLGRALQSSDSLDSFLDSLKTSNSNQIGVIDNFNSKKPVTVRPFLAQTNLPLSVQYFINTKDENIISNVINEVKPLITASENVWVINNSNNLLNQDNLDTNSVNFYVLMFALIYIFVIITFIYYLISRYKELGVLKMFGNSNSSLIKKIISKDILPLFGIAETVNIVFTFLALIIYNRLSDFWGFALVWLAVQIGVILLSLILFTLLSQIVKKIKVINMIKKDKPSRSIHTVNILTKMIFAILTISMVLSSVNSVSEILQQNKDIHKWNETKNYVYLRCTVPISAINNKESKESYITELLANKKMADYFEKTNNNGSGIFMHPSTTLNSQLPSYAPQNNSIYINNNYLKLNPIYDTNNNQVNLNDEYTKTMTILVPEKYKPFEQEVKSMYEKERTFQYYVQEDSLNRATGKLDPKEKIEHDTMPINILYVKDNQSYFSYHPYRCSSNSNRSIDPIAMVSNNVNTDKIEIGNMMGSGYTVKYDNLNLDHPMETAMEDLIATDNTDSMQVYSLYRLVDKYISAVYQQIFNNIMVMLISVAILILISVISISNYLEDRRLINAVYKIHGYSFFKRHWHYLITIPIFWIAMMLLFPVVFSVLGSVSLTLNFISSILGNFSVFNTSILNMIIISLIAILLEFVVSLPIIKIKERKQTKDVLKGV